MLFAVAEFDDGLHLVPSVWLTENNQKCLWPENIRNQVKLNSIIANQTKPDSSWKMYTVKKIYGYADTYVTGIEKLKLYQNISDIDSNSDNGKSQRKLIKRKKFMSDSDDDEGSQSIIPQYPKVPKKLTGVVEDCSLSFSSLDSSVENSKLKANEKVGCNCNCDEKLEANKKILELLLQKVNFMLKKVSSLEEKINLKCEEDKAAKPLNCEFPFSELKNLINFDNTLNDDEVFKNLVKSLKVIGGNSAYHVVSNILKRLLTNAVGELFSWAGAKKKMAFKNLKIARAIIETTRSSFPGCTEEEVGILIANWLRHARQRRERAEGMAAKIDKISNLHLDSSLYDHSSADLTLLHTESTT